jgi:hypothetical protein
MKLPLVCRISFLILFFVTLPLLALGASGLPAALNTLQNAKIMGLLEPGTLLLLTLGGGGAVYLNTRKPKN